MKRATIQEKAYVKDTSSVAYKEKISLKEFIPKFILDKYYTEKTQQLLDQYFTLSIAMCNGNLADKHYYADLYNMDTKVWEYYDDNTVQIKPEDFDYNSNAIALVYIRKDLGMSKDNIEKYKIEKIYNENR